MRQLTYAQIGTLYNSITNELAGGVTPQNQEQLLNQVSTVQTQLQNLINSGAFNNAVDANGANATIVHAQNIVDQTNFLTQAISNYGTANNGVPAPKIINDVQRDIQDISTGDPVLNALAHQNNASGFQQTSNLLTNPTPFADSATQAAFLTQFGTDSNSLAARAQAAVGTDPHSATVTQLISDINTFSANADTFANAQGGVYSARFDNELTLNGVQGTATRELVTGLQTGNTALVNGAATVLTQNAMDVQSNNSSNGIDIGTGQPVVAAKNGGIPAVNDVHSAGLVFSDAVTKLIGGVGASNQTSVVNDLNATQAGLQSVLANGGISGQELKDLTHAVSLLGQESSLVAGINTANPTPVSQVNGQIGRDQAAILNIINHDPTLSAAAVGADGTTGFVALPPGVTQHGKAGAGAVGQADNGGAQVGGVAAGTIPTPFEHDMTTHTAHVPDFHHLWG